MGNVSEKIYREIQIHFALNIFFFSFFKSYRLCDNVEKYGTPGEVTDDIMLHIHLTLGT